MEKKLERAANQELISSYALCKDGEFLYKSFAMINMFKKGAKWQKENMWISVKEGLPEVENSVFVLTKNGKISVSKMYIPKDCHGNILGEKEWHGSASFRDSIIAWMPIPKFKKGE